jgi:DNA-binding MurR/RpiR family transcriptional regulator
MAKKKTKKTNKTGRKVLSTATTNRILNLLRKDKYTYREIATRCKVSAPTVARLSKKKAPTHSATHP